MANLETKKQMIRTALTNLENWKAINEGWEGTNFNHHWDCEIEMAEEDKKEIFVAAYQQRKAKWFNNKTNELIEFEICEVSISDWGDCSVRIDWDSDGGLDLKGYYQNEERERFYLYFSHDVLDDALSEDDGDYEIFEQVACEMFGLENPNFLQAVNQ